MALDALRARFQFALRDLFSLTANLSLQFNGNWVRALPMEKDSSACGSTSSETSWQSSRASPSAGSGRARRAIGCSFRGMAS
jgi:hypothetical protein